MNRGEDNEIIAKNAVGIAEKVAFLRQPSAYPFPVAEVKVKETHMSWVFLAGDFVYKLKKPVKYNFFDHRSPESRLKNSLEELQINKPLAREIYIGVFPLVIDQNGKLVLERPGKPVDWLVKMKRISENVMLDIAITRRDINELHLRNAATLLAEFYASSSPVPVTFERYIKKLESEIFFNYNQLTDPLFDFPVTLLKELTAGQMAFLSAHQAVFERRVADKRIIDAHGDLRPEHICLGPRAAIIDRLEFCRDLRIMDTAEELSFFIMECDMMHDTHVGHVFLDIYGQVTYDRIPHELINFYKIKRACLRAYLVARHIREARYKDDPKWIGKANTYLSFAERVHQEFAS